jgi:hypothetical protein
MYQTFKKVVINRQRILPPFMDNLGALFRRCRRNEFLQFRAIDDPWAAFGNHLKKPYVGGFRSRGNPMLK